MKSSSDGRANRELSNGPTLAFFCPAQSKVTINARALSSTRTHHAHTHAPRPTHTNHAPHARTTTLHARTTPNTHVICPGMKTPRIHAHSTPYARVLSPYTHQSASHACNMPHTHTSRPTRPRHALRAREQEH